VRVNLTWQDGRLLADLISQAAFFDRSSGRWVHFSDTEIEAGALSNAPTRNGQGPHLCTVRRFYSLPRLPH
jgi:hypothetical protein